MSDIEDRAKTLAQEEIQPKAMKAAQETSAKVRPGAKAQAYELKLEQEWARLYPEAYRRHYSALLAKSFR